ncbi:MAG: hypothetical protein H7Y08_01635 [Rhizobiaceae bacterium]|nr:hypothetical protein [Rhizobiaceae bacterium]
MSNDAGLQGKLAFDHNLPMSACNYPNGSTLREDWMKGWTQARNARPQAMDVTPASRPAEADG